MPRQHATQQRHSSNGWSLGALPMPDVSMQIAALKAAIASAESTLTTYKAIAIAAIR